MHFGGPWVATTLIFVVLLTVAKEGYGENVTVEEEGSQKDLYRRKYRITIPEPLVCFPGFDDKVLATQNVTILEDIYNFKVVKLYDFAPILTGMGVPVFIASSILKVLLRYADKQWFQDLGRDLVDEKIDAALAKSEIARLRAKIDTIYNRLSTVMDDQYPKDVKIAELVVAVDKSEEILNTFRDRDFSFKKYPEASMPFLILFYGPCKILLQVAGTLIPSKVEVYENQLERLRDTVEEYKRITLNGRIEQLLFDKVSSYPDPWTVTKNVFKHQVWSYDYDIKLLDRYGGWGPCHNVQRFETYNETESEILQDKLITDYVKTLKERYEDFFESPIRVFQHQECQKTCDTTSSSAPICLVPVFIWVSTLISWIVRASYLSTFG